MDGRAPYDVRHLHIGFGTDFGCAQVKLGETRILTQVSCKMNVPKDARPAEGLMKINVGEKGKDLGFLMSLHFCPQFFVPNFKYGTFSKRIELRGLKSFMVLSYGGKRLTSTICHPISMKFYMEVTFGGIQLKRNT